MDRQVSSRALLSGPSSARVSQRATINQLPQELIVIIFRLSIDSKKHVKVLKRLALVCRLWKAIVEGTPSFWTNIKAADGIKHARNAITKTGESPIDLTLETRDSISVAWFLAAVSEKVSHWRSVKLSFEALPTSFGGLETSACHSLEKLSLTWDAWEPDLSTSRLTLFDRGPAPTGLKNLFLWSIPVDLAPMRLCKLSSLVLVDVPYIATDDILFILRNSPTLITLHLQELDGLVFPEDSVGLPALLECLSTCTFHLPTPLIRFLLSAIHAPSLRRVELAVACDGSSIFSPPVSEFEPTLKKLLSTAEHIKVKFGKLDCSITFWGLKIILESPGVDSEGPRYLRNVLESLMDYSGGEGTGPRIHLHVDAADPTMEELLIFNESPAVEQLTLSERFWSDSIPRNAVDALGTPAAPGLDEWLFPELEVIDWNVNLDVLDKLETALDKRYSTQQAYADEHQCPRPLRELRFFSSNTIEMGPVDIEALQSRLRVLARGARVFLRNAMVDFGTPA
ncbi:hypothetical protein FRC01_001101 [Tulasnella sp. 417]|nr:hypothetical protein FRC01_001101 [Tulasnella sp. 417]